MTTLWSEPQDKAICVHSLHLCASLSHSKLVINQIIPEDDAIYQCQAENEQGSVLSMARLIVVMSEDRPSAPRNIRADTVSSSAILLAWERPLYNSDKVIAYSVHYMKAEGESCVNKQERTRVVFSSVFVTQGLLSLREENY